MSGIHEYAGGAVRAERDDVVVSPLTLGGGTAGAGGTGGGGGAGIGATSRGTERGGSPKDGGACAMDDWLGLSRRVLRTGIGGGVMGVSSIVPRRVLELGDCRFAIGVCVVVVVVVVCVVVVVFGVASAKSNCCIGERDSFDDAMVQSLWPSQAEFSTVNKPRDVFVAVAHCVYYSGR